tara:strand:+ start:4561 stop:4794 length:234 start_codon:yes stop_codon:yes gene_type:complete
MRDKTHQQMRNTLASTIRALKRDHEGLDDRDIQYDLGYIYGLNYAISLYINDEFWMYEIPEINRVNRFIGRLFDRVS